MTWTGADWGWALGGAAGLFTAFVTGGLQIAIFRRQGRQIAAGEARDRSIAQVHNLVNGMSHEKKVADDKLAHAEGVAEGIEKERADPMVHAPKPIDGSGE